MTRISRRELLAAGGVAAVGTLAGAGAPETRLLRDRKARLSVAPEDRAPQSGAALLELRDWYRRELFEAYLPFEDRFVVDHELGGFMYEVDPQGTRVSSTKNAWMDGRGLWVRAFLYNRFGGDRHHLEVARKTADLLLRVGPSGPDGLWPRVYTREGQPIAYADGEIYGDLFIAEGFDEYAAATGDDRHARRARELVLKCVRLYDRPDYRPVIGRTYLGPDARPFPGARILGVWMVLLRVATQMLERRRDPEIEGIAERAVRAVLDHHLNPAFDLLNELLEHDLARPGNEYAQLVYTGHAIEVLWMVMDEALRRSEAALFDRAAALFRRHLTVARDEVYDGLFRNLQHVDRHVWQVDKVLWLQVEALIGLLMMVEQRGDQWAATEYERLRGYVTTTYPLRARGVDSPVWIYAADRTVSLESFHGMPARFENYHRPRHLMLNLLAAERMASRPKP